MPCIPERPPVGAANTLKFASDSAFQLELRRRVDAFFLATGRRQRDCWQMYVKTAVFLAGFAVSYWLLVFVAQVWWQGVLLAILLGFSAAGIGFNIQHDGGHQAYSNRPWVNKLMAMTLELIGGSSYLWPLYGLLAIKWQLVDDVRKLISGRISNQPFPAPRAGSW